MSEKPETEEFDDEEDEAAIEATEDLDVDRLLETFDKRKRSGVKPGEPAWRRLERIREERETAELVSDFDDYDIGDDGDKPRRRRKIS
jgi:hypothetical protein